MTNHRLARMPGGAGHRWAHAQECRLERRLSHVSTGRSSPVEAAALAERFGSPLWVIDEARLLDNLKGFAALTNGAERVFYPIKANPTPALIELLARAGAGADCASYHEIQLAQLAAIPFSRILYTNPAPDRMLARRLLREGAGVVIDNADDLHWLERNDASGGMIMLRVHPDLPTSYAHTEAYQDLTAHAAEGSKFGLGPQEVLDLAGTTKLRISGLHVHVGTQMDHLGPFVFVRKLLEQLGGKLRSMGHPVQLLDLGGGLGLPFASSKHFPSITEYRSAVLQGRDESYKLAVEPGHALVGDSVTLLTRVQRIKTSRGKRFAICDAGTDLLAKVTLLRWPHRVMHAHQELPQEGPDVLSGPLCFGGDNLLATTRLDHVKEGDVLRILDSGAYCSALANHFNGRHGPATVILPRKGDPYLAHEREDAGLEPSLQTALWRDGRAPMPQDETGRCLPLSSSYLHHLANSDRYEFTRIDRLGDRAIQAHVMTKADVAFVSAPFALRIAGDACIILVLRMLGKAEKTIPIWARRVVMNCADSVPAGQPLVCTVRASEISTREGGGHRVWTHFDLGDGRCTGRMEAVFADA